MQFVQCNACVKELMWSYNCRLRNPNFGRLHSSDLVGEEQHCSLVD